MADTAIAITAGSGTNVDTRTEATNGNHRQVVVVGDPATNAGVAPVDGTAGLKVDLGADNDVVVSSGTVTTVSAVTAITNALPAGNNNIGDVDIASALPAGTNAIGKLAANSGVDIGDVDVTSLPALAAGTNNIGDVDVLTINGVAPAFNTGARGATVQRVTIATDDVVPVTDNGGSLTVDGSVTANAGTNLNTSALALESGGNLAAQTASLSVMDDWDDGSDRARVVGAAAHDAAVAGNPVLTAGEARTSLGTAVANGDVVRAAMDKYGRTIVKGMDMSWATSNGTPITGTTTSVVAAPSSGNHLEIGRIHFSNAGSTAAIVAIRDGASGNRYFETYLPQGGVVSLDLAKSGYVPLTSATRLDITVSAAGSISYTLGYLTIVD